MNDLTSLGLILTISAAMACLCRCSRHVVRKLDTSSNRNRPGGIRLGGWLLLFLSGLSAVAHYSWGLGLTFLFGAISLCCLPVVALACYRPAWLMPLSSIGLLAGTILLFPGLTILS